MLQWKSRLIALVVILVVIASLLGQLTWDGLSQLTW
jgi:hypothetical protein